MYQLVSRVDNGLGELRTLLEAHVTQQGLSAIEKLGAEALNVSFVIAKTLVFLINREAELKFLWVCVTFRTRNSTFRLCWTYIGNITLSLQCHLITILAL